jgi:co-chaperonin GroES (HSP10)
VLILNNPHSGISLKLVDRVLVKVFIKPENEELFRTRSSGLLIPNADLASNKAFNFGKIVQLPHMLSEEKYHELALDLKKDMTVFFSASKSYNYIEHEDGETFKLLMIPLYDIDAYYEA